MSNTTVKLAVNGTLMRGLELEKNMINAGAKFLFESRTEKCYRLWSIRDIHPAMLRVDPAAEPCTCLLYTSGPAQRRSAGRDWWRR